MTNKPNIVFILSDDQGEWAMGCSGNKEIITPNIDKLAAQGMRFTNFFCASPVCSPARASLFTGRIPSQHGVHDWLRDDTKEQSEIEYLAGQYTYMQALSDNGYITGLSGKWHLGNTSKAQQGFSHWYSHKSGGGPYYNAPLYKDGELYHEGRYVTNAITDDALEFLDNCKGKQEPFYLNVGYTAPHSPWLNNHPKEYTDMYADCKFDSVPHLPRHPNAVSLTDKVAQDERGNLIGYYAAVTAMDADIGRIVDKIDEMGIRDNTLIVFTADNGFSCGHHGFWGKGNSTFPLNMYDESVKVPFIASFKGSIAQNTVSDALVSAYDFMPTVLQCAGIKPNPNVECPGVSFANVLMGKESEARSEVVVYDEYGPNRMIRTRDTKLVCRYPYGPNELYDLANDPREEHNLLCDNKDDARAKELKCKMEKWFMKYVNCEIDGAKEAVNGSGQKGLAGLWSNGDNSYNCDNYIKASPNFLPYLK